MRGWVAAVAALGFWASAAAEAAPVLLISVDGLQPGDVLEAEARGLQIPHLRKLVAEGAAAEGVIGTLPTVTYPSHTTLITGASAAVHGVASNVTFDPLRKNQGGWYWYEEAIQVETLWDAVAAKGRAVGSISWPVSVGARAIRYNVPEYWRARTPDDLLLLRAVSSPGLPDELERNGVSLSELSNPDGLKADAVRAAMAKHILAKKPELTTLHLIELDHQQHEHGPGSPEAHAALEGIDRLIGEVIAAGRKAQPDLVVAVASDHGFEKIEQQVNLGVALAQAGLVTLNEKGEPTEWKAAVWISGGAAQIMLQDPQDAATREKLAKLLRALAAVPEHGIDRVVEREEAEKLGGNPEAAFWVNAKPGYTMGGAFIGALVTETKTRGMHGYFPDAPAMHATFVAAGPGVPKGKRLGVIDMRDIAPTLAKLLRVQLKTAEGKPLF